MQLHPIKTLLVALFALGMAALASCNGANDPCDGFACGQGTSCLITDGLPNCVPDGGISGGGQLGPGEACDDDSDCQANLTCQADLNGNLVCND